MKLKAASSWARQSHFRLPITSPVQHSLWMRTLMRLRASISPATMAMCSLPVSFSRKP